MQIQRPNARLHDKEKKRRKKKKKKKKNDTVPPLITIREAVTPGHFVVGNECDRKGRRAGKAR